jgi:hypothetical protein
LKPNKEKYRDKGHKPATGRAGSAVLTTRALLGKDGMTTLDVSTGELDAITPAPGTLSRVEVKLLTPKGKTVWRHKYKTRRGNGSAQYVYGGLIRGSVLEVEAKVRDIEPHRTDVATVVDTVQLRPDLAATIAAAPATAPARTLVNIVATVRELNGDVGARADCLLSVNGVAADRASEIWVDAGRSVSCAFTTSFAAAGTYRLSVGVTGVVPGDYDTANNTVSTSIRVIDPVALAYGASVRDQSYAYAYDYTQHLESARGNREWERDETMTYEGREQGSYISATLPRAVSFPLTRLEVSQATNGVTFHSAVYENISPDWGYTYSYSSGGVTYTYNTFSAYTEATNGAFVQVILVSGTATDASGVAAPWTSVHYYRFAGDVTYRGAIYERSWNPSAEEAGSYYVTNASGDWYRPPAVDYGGDFTFRVLLNDRGTLYGATPTIPLRAFASAIGEQPFSCSSYTDGDGSTTRSCFRYRYYNISGVEGSAQDAP